MDKYLLKPLNEDDAQTFFDLIENNRPRLEAFFSGTVAKTKTFDDTSNYLKEIIEKQIQKTYLAFFVIDSESQKIIGFMDAKNIDWNLPKAELGCFIDKNFANQGIAAEPFSAFIHHLFSTYHFTKLFLRTHESNEAAKALAIKTGFIQEGVLRSDYKSLNGEFLDLIYFGILHHEFKKWHNKN
ncbi:MAG: GNAT family N-acetyltransferase [Chitinophagaceae bacterium]|nr:GNAT family N-acetyltransferase [Chitinophagaceae bacterium]